MNKIGAFVEIINEKECLRGFNLYKNASWPSIDIKAKASEDEWNLHGFSPISGNVGEIIGIVANDIYSEPVYVIRILKMFFVPITSLGIKLISEEEYNKRVYSQIQQIKDSPEYITREKDKLFKVIWQDDYAGFIDNNGNLITNFIYEMATPFKEGRALVKRDHLWGFIDYEGNEIIKAEYETANSFKEGRAIVETYKWNAINHNGEPVSKLYDYMGDYCNGLSGVLLNNNWGFIDLNGFEKIPLTFDSVNSFNNGHAIIKQNGKYGIINTAGQVIIPPTYDFISGVSKNKKFSASLNDKWGIINLYGKPVVNLEYDSLFIYDDEMFYASKNKKYGYINDDNEIIIPFIYDDASVFVNGMAKVVIGKKTGYIDTKNNIVIPFIYDGGESETAGLLPVRKGQKWGCINRLGDLVIPFKLNSSCWFVNNVAEVAIDDESWLVNNEGLFIKKL